MKSHSKRVLVVFGTRPEAIKMAPVVMALKKSKRLTTQVCVTAQHRGMLDQMLSVFGISPKADLNLMRASQSLTDITTAALRRLENVFRELRPDIVLVHGDTTTTFAAALAAFYQNIPVGHVEAGLRSHDARNPYPEELNRRLADALSALHFAPTEGAKKNLLAEGVSAKNIFITGNTAIDALRWVVARPHIFRDLSLRRFLPAPLRPTGLRALCRRPTFGGYPCSGAHRLIIVTAHRRESFGKPLRNICRALKEIVRLEPSVRILYPVHLNPNVRRVVRGELSSISRIHLLEPLDYPDFAHLMKRAALILTDSGGIQEEAPSLNVPVLVMRDVTERPEAVSSGCARLVGTQPAKILFWARRLLHDQNLHAKMARAKNPHGDGRASQRILSGVLHFFGCADRPADFRA